MKLFNKKLLEVNNNDYKYYVQDNVLYADISDNLSKRILQSRLSISNKDFIHKIFNINLRIVEFLEIDGNIIFYAGNRQSANDYIYLEDIPFKTKLALMEGLNIITNYYNNLLKQKKS